MKIIGFAYENGAPELLLKSDSSLVVNRKPFFVPEDVTRLNAHPCLVLRVCKLGKDISPRFALRYVDAFAAGLHIEAANLLEEAQQGSHSWTRAVAFDGTLPVGTFLPIPEAELQDEANRQGSKAPLSVALPALTFRLNGEERTFAPMLGIAEAVSRISRSLTIRQGDLIFICGQDAPFHPAEDQYIEGFVAGEDNLYCKIK